MVTSVQSLAQALVEFLDGRSRPGTIWLVATVAIVAAAAQVEKVKVFQEE